MGVIGIIMLVLFVIVCILLILLVVIQNENSEGLGGIFGGSSDTTFGNQSGNIMTKMTYIVGGLFILLAFGLGYVNRTPDTDQLLKAVKTDTVIEQTENWWNQDTTESQN